MLQHSFFTPRSSRQFLRRPVSSTPFKTNPQSIASLAAASAAAKIDTKHVDSTVPALDTHALNMDVNTDTKPMDSTVPATSPAAATDKKAVAEAAATKDHQTRTRSTRVDDESHFASTINVRTLPRPTAPPHRPSRHV